MNNPNRLLKYFLGENALTLEEKSFNTIIIPIIIVIGLLVLLHPLSIKEPKERNS